MHGGTRMRSIFVVVAWRNLWRNKRRTWLTSGGIAFAVYLVVLAMSIQVGSYAGMIDISTRLLSGHAQIQHPDYLDRPGVHRTVAGAQALSRRLAALESVGAVAQRAEGFAIASVGEKSFAVQVVGVEPDREPAVSNIPNMLINGSYLQGAGDAFVGAAVARNLGVAPGDELALLGTSKNGGVAVLSVRISGVFRTGTPGLDRALIQVPLASLQEAFELSDEVHRILLVAASVDGIETMLNALDAELEEQRLLPWFELLPEVAQSIELDWIGNMLFYAILLLLVVFSVANTFIMTLFERTREFGMLLSIGMRSGALISMLQAEALCMWLIGAGLGLGLVTLSILVLLDIGIPLSGDLGEVARQMMMPDTIYPAFSVRAYLISPLALLAGMSMAALLPSLRVRKLQPIEALHGDE